MGTKLDSEPTRASRKGCPNHPIDFKRRLAELACEPGVSVSKLALEHGLNANQLFRWRRQYRAGLFGTSDATPAMLPITVVDAASAAQPTEARHDTSMAAPAEEALSAGTIEVHFADVMVRIGHGIEPATLRAVLAALRR
ncbi:transposase [Burkholderia diffusa]|nr:transposase [Burkholderia diffusa]